VAQDPQDFKDQLDLKELRVLLEGLEALARLDHKEFKVSLVELEVLVPLVQQDPQVFKAILVAQDPQDLKDKLDFEDFRVLME
jgi:hypothetical protein